MNAKTNLALLLAKLVFAYPPSEGVVLKKSGAAQGDV